MSLLVIKNCFALKKKVSNKGNSKITLASGGEGRPQRQQKCAEEMAPMFYELLGYKLKTVNSWMEELRLTQHLCIQGLTNDCLVWTLH
jgi:hypothetical protein